jgi:hypothetical protein
MTEILRSLGGMVLALADGSGVLGAPVVDRTPADKVRPGYREVQVVAIQRGFYEGHPRRPGDVFTMGLIGAGRLPAWVSLSSGTAVAPAESGIARRQLRMRQR